MYSLSQGFVISRYSSTCFTITGVKKTFVIPRTSVYKGSLYQGSTVTIFSPSYLNFLEQPVKIQQNKLYNSKVLMSTLTFFMAPCHWVMFFLCALVK